MTGEDDAADPSASVDLLPERAARDSFDDARLQIGEDVGGYGGSEGLRQRQLLLSAEAGKGTLGERSVMLPISSGSAMPVQTRHAPGHGGGAASIGSSSPSSSRELAAACGAEGVPTGARGVQGAEE